MPGYFTIARREAINQHRKRRHLELPEDFDPAAPEHDHEDEWVEKLKRCIERYTLNQDPFRIDPGSADESETTEQAWNGSIFHRGRSRHNAVAGRHCFASVSEI